MSAASYTRILCLLLACSVSVLAFCSTAPHRLAISPSSAPADSAAVSLTILSWNVYRNYNPEAIEASLKTMIEEHHPDLLLLQEVTIRETARFETRPFIAHYHEFYAPMHVVHERTRWMDFDASGQLILSDEPFTDAVALDLPEPALWFRRDTTASRLVRNALYVRLPLEDGRTLGVYNVHLENRAWPGGRLKQTEHLIGLIEAHDDDAVVVGGDFNTYLSTRLEPALQAFLRAGFTLAARARHPLLPAMDYIFVRGVRTVEEITVRGQGSDHPPVMTKIWL